MQQRYYDPVIGRFYSNDPVGFKIDNPMSFNRYLYVNNNPYKYTDPTGEELRVEGSKEFQEKVAKDLAKIESKPGGKELVDGIRNHKLVVVIKEQTNLNKTNEAFADNTAGATTKGVGSNASINYSDSHVGGKDVNGNFFRPPFIGLAHELGHAEDYINGNRVEVDKLSPEFKASGSTPLSEKNSIFRENQVRQEHGISLRGAYND